MSTTRSAAQRKRNQALRDSARHDPRAVAARAARPGRPAEEEEEAWILPHRRWPWIAGTLITLAGIAVATYLTWVHYHPGLKLACPDTGIINCAAVTSSQYSSILGVPVALLGLLYFVAMLPLQLPVAWRSPSRWVRGLRVAGAVAGIAMVLWLVTAELMLVGKICIYCTSVHLLTFALLAVVVFGTIATAPRPASELD